MRKFLQYIFTILMLTALVLMEHAAIAQGAATDTSRKASSAVIATASASEASAQRSSFLSSFRNLLPFKSANAVSDKLLSSVKVFPNPIVDQISLSFRLDKQSNVSIKVMDALGNEVMTLLNQDLDAGPQSHVFDTNNKLTNGFYFIRVSAGTETVVKRISVL